MRRVYSKLYYCTDLRGLFASWASGLCRKTVRNVTQATIYMTVYDYTDYTIVYCHTLRYTTISRRHDCEQRHWVVSRSSSYAWGNIGTLISTHTIVPPNPYSTYNRPYIIAPSTSCNVLWDAGFTCCIDDVSCA